MHFSSIYLTYYLYSRELLDKRSSDGVNCFCSSLFMDEKNTSFQHVCSCLCASLLDFPLKWAQTALQEISAGPWSYNVPVLPWHPQTCWLIFHCLWVLSQLKNFLILQAVIIAITLVQVFTASSICRQMLDIWHQHVCITLCSLCSTKSCDARHSTQIEVLCYIQVCTGTYSVCTFTYIVHTSIHTSKYQVAFLGCTWYNSVCVLCFSAEQPFYAVFKFCTCKYIPPCTTGHGPEEFVFFKKQAVCT